MPVKKRGYIPPAQSTEWGTPQAFFDDLDRMFHFTLDPCATGVNAKCKKFYTVADDGLAQSWDGEVVFMNPPYGRGTGPWVKKASEASAIVVCLLPSRTDVKWFHEFVYGKAEIRFLKGRLSFEGSKGPAPFPSMLVIFKPSLQKRVDRIKASMDRLLERPSKDPGPTVLHVRTWRKELY